MDPLIIFTGIYIILNFFYLLIWYFVYKGLAQTQNSTISATAKLLAYRKKTAAMMIFPLGISTILIFYSMGIGNMSIMILPLIITGLVVIYTFTIYMKNANSLIADIKKENAKVGGAAHFLFGTSNFREVAITFLVFAGLFAILVIVIWYLVKNNII